MSQQQISTPRRAAIVGCGDVSVVHAEAIAAIDGIELVAVCDSDPARLARAEAYAGVPGFSSVEALLDAGGVDVVHVTTPHHQHAPVTIACLRAGVHVIQEKPLAHTLEVAETIVDAAAASTAKIGICFQNRYNVSSVELKKLLDAGALGAIRGAYASVVWTRTADYYRNAAWRGHKAESGGGVLINQAIHTLDLVQWLRGEPTTITGQASTRKFAGVIDVEDTADAIFTHADGTTTTWFSTLSAPSDRPVELELVGELGTALIRDGLTVRWADGRVDVIPERAAPSGGRAYWGVSHELLIRDFYARLDDPEPFWITPAESLASLRMLTAIYEQSPQSTHEGVS